MTGFDQFRMISAAQAHRARSVFRTISAQPNWIFRLAGLAFILVLGLPIVALSVLAVFAAIVVFSILAAVNILMTRLRWVLPRNDGRSNVRVIRRP
jgi:hypothetical protein